MGLSIDHTCSMFCYKEMAAVYSASDLTLLIAHDTVNLQTTTFL